MKILVFSPSSAIWDWSYPAALVAESLQKRGDDVAFLTCDREYSRFCMAQAASAVKFRSSQAEKDKICDLCVAQRDLMTDELSLNRLIINSYISEADRTFAKKMADEVSFDNYADYVVDGVPVGRLAMYEIIIQNKKQTLTFSPEEWSFYREILFNVIKTVKGFGKVLAEIKPDVCLIEHTAYSYNRAGQLLSSLKGIPSYCINGNSYNNAHCFELLTIAKEDPIIFVQNYLKGWPKLKHIPINLHEASYVTDHFISLMAARGHIYSSAKTKKTWSIRERFRVLPHQKILLATTSSLDEMFATEIVGNFEWNTKSTVFESQVEWIRNLFQLLKDRTDLFLIVRIHPREFMPGQNGEISEHAKMLQKELKNIPANASVNWPGDKVSIYDLIEEVDVVLNAWSTAGLEMTYLGIPVVVYCGHMLLYPDDLTYSAKSRPEYYRFIDEALKEGWNFERVRTAYRWCVTQHLRVSADISDSFPYNIFKPKPFLLRVIQKIGAIFDPLFREKWQVFRRAKVLKSTELIRNLLLQKKDTFLDVQKPAAQTSLEDETRAIKKEIKRLYKNVYGNTRAPVNADTLQYKLWKLFSS